MKGEQNYRSRLNARRTVRTVEEYINFLNSTKIYIVALLLGLTHSSLLELLVATNFI